MPRLSGSNRRFQFDKRGQFLIRSHNEALSIAAMCVCIPSILFKQFLQLLV